MMNAKFMLLNRKLARTFFVSLLKSFKFQEPCSICVDCFAIGCARAVARFHHRLEIILPRPCFQLPLIYGPIFGIHSATFSMMSQLSISCASSRRSIDQPLRYAS